jgi:hypothetical protein
MLTGMADAPLLEQLAEADILLIQGLPPDSDYRFKHAPIQDAAYENLPQEPATRRRSTAADSCTFVRPCFAERMPAARLHFGTRAGTKGGGGLNELLGGCPAKSSADGGIWFARPIN